MLLKLTRRTKQSRRAAGAQLPLLLLKLAGRSAMHMRRWVWMLPLPRATRQSSDASHACWPGCTTQKPKHCS